MSKMLTTDNYEKNTVGASLRKFSFLQRFLIDNFNKILISEVKKLKPSSILDAGCGEGFTLKRLKDAGIGKKLEGFDYLDRAVKLGAKQYPGLNIKKGDIYKINSKANSFDVVICSEVLEHLERPEDAIRELIRVSKRYLVLSVPQEPLFMLGNLLRGKNVRRFGNDIEHINHWSNGSFVKFVSKHLKVKQNITPLPWTLLVAEKKM
ncbi:MAG TPA: class I SAM-dependent methyltransferase [Candidatus Limnocylindrales bacterium]|nr:class I SAM-dependent methyltransferase [Candidatus Limnocylindrales bacterium]